MAHAGVSIWSGLGPPDATSGAGDAAYWRIASWKDSACSVCWARSAIQSITCSSITRALQASHQLGVVAVQLNDLLRLLVGRGDQLQGLVRRRLGPGAARCGGRSRRPAGRPARACAPASMNVRCASAGTSHLLALAAGLLDGLVRPWRGLRPRPGAAAFRRARRRRSAARPLRGAGGVISAPLSSRSRLLRMSARNCSGSPLFTPKLLMKAASTSGSTGSETSVALQVHLHGAGRRTAARASRPGSRPRRSSLRRP